MLRGGRARANSGPQKPARFRLSIRGLCIGESRRAGGAIELEASIKRPAKEAGEIGNRAAECGSVCHGSKKQSVKCRDACRKAFKNEELKGRGEDEKSTLPRPCSLSLLRDLSNLRRAVPRGVQPRAAAFPIRFGRPGRQLPPREPCRVLHLSLRAWR